MVGKGRKNRNSFLRFFSRRRIAYGASVLLLSFLLTAILVQFVPPLFIAEVQIEFFLVWAVCLLLLSVACLWLLRRYWWRVAIPMSVVLLLFPLFVGWSYPMLAQSVAQFFTHARNRISSQVEVKLAKGGSQPHISLQQRIRKKVDYTSPEVRTFAVRNSLLYFDEYYGKYGQICRQFSLIKSIKEQYKYVRDPNGFDYFAGPVESIALMAGDCDDHSILMASALESIGAQVRIIWAPGHVYPELFCGDQNSFDRYVSAVYALFNDEVGGKRIYYRLDKDGNYWMNIDYTDSYPGSVYLLEEVLSIIYIK